MMGLGTELLERTMNGTGLDYRQHMLRTSDMLATISQGERGIQPDCCFCLPVRRLQATLVAGIPPFLVDLDPPLGHDLLAWDDAGARRSHHLKTNQHLDGGSVVGQLNGARLRRSPACRVAELRTVLGLVHRVAIGRGLEGIGGAEVALDQGGPPRLGALADALRLRAARHGGLSGAGGFCGRRARGWIGLGQIRLNDAGLSDIRLVGAGLTWRFWC
jgi:hypothetical protein